MYISLGFDSLLKIQPLPDLLYILQYEVWTNTKNIFIIISLLDRGFWAVLSNIYSKRPTLQLSFRLCKRTRNLFARCTFYFSHALWAISCNIPTVNLSITSGCQHREELACPSGCSPCIINPEPSELNLSFRSIKCQGCLKALISVCWSHIKSLLCLCGWAYVSDLLG